MAQWYFLEMILRTTLSFAVLLVMTRLMGRKQLSQLTFFNYITGIALGTIAASIASDSSTPIWNILTSLVWWSILTILVGYIGLKNATARVIVDGQPVVVIKRGNILERELKKLRLNMDDLNMLLREQRIFSIRHVEHAIFEANGKLSVMVKKAQQPVTKGEQHIVTVQPTYIPIALVMDGKLLKKNIQEAGITSNWLVRQLASQNMKLEDVFYVELQDDGSLYINQYDNLLPR